MSGATATRVRRELTVERLGVGAYTIPTDAPESDGTIEWDSTTIVVVEARGGGEIGLGYTYADASAAALVTERLAPLVCGLDATAVPHAWERMVGAVRNIGRPGIASTAIAAVDAALWDLKARLLGIPSSRCSASSATAWSCTSGGFTSHSDAQLERQLGGWARTASVASR
ncbi:MAG: hypothetical protein WKF41_15995 [Gaiellaceae bacterium]